MQTIQVIWKGKFGGKPVTINEADFDPTIHRLMGDPVSADEPVEDAAPVPEPAEAPEPEPAKPTRGRKK